MDDRRIAADDGSFWEKVAAEGDATGWDESFQDQTYRSMQAKSLLDYSVEIRELVCFSILRKRRELRVAELFSQPRQRRGIQAEKICFVSAFAEEPRPRMLTEDSPQGDCSGVRAGVDVTERPSQQLRFWHLSVVLLCMQR